MQLQKVIQNLGYSPSETKVYLAALQMGGSKVLDIAKKSGLPRTSVQEIVVKLSHEGLMDPITRNNHRFWVAENPEKLLTTLKERQSALQAVMPELQALRYDFGAKPTIKILQGVKEIKKIFDDIIETKHHLKAIVSWDDWVIMLGKDIVYEFIERRVNHFLKMRLLTPSTELSNQLKKKDSQELRTTCYLPADIHIHTSNFIYGNKVAIISLNRKMPVCTIIEDQDISETMSILFESLWQKSSSN